MDGYINIDPSSDSGRCYLQSSSCPESRVFSTGPGLIYCVNTVHCRTWLRELPENYACNLFEPTTPEGTFESLFHRSMVVLRNRFRSKISLTKRWPVARKSYWWSLRFSLLSTPQELGVHVDFDEYTPEISNVVHDWLCIARRGNEMLLLVQDILRMTFVRNAHNIKTSMGIFECIRSYPSSQSQLRKYNHISRNRYG